MPDSDRAQQIRDRKDAELAQGERIGFQPLPPRFSCAVVGVSFVDTYPDNIHSLELAWADAEIMGENLTAIVVRNPDNPHDRNACQVHVPALGDHAFIGHINKVQAARLAPEIDRGAIWQAEITGVRTHPDHPDRPGIDVALTRK
jgi:hypothetical protein